MDPTQKNQYTLKKSLQILVFQDGLASRNFEIPVRWFSQLGWIIGGSILATSLSLGVALNIWRQSHQAQPERLKELEQQIQGLEAQLVQASKQPAPAAPAEPAEQEPAPVTAQPVQPAPAVTVTVTATPSLPQFNLFTSKGGATDGQPALHFTAFPPSVKGEIPWVARPSVPVEITPPQILWQGRKLKLNFQVRYIGPEGKGQQGRIVVIARGPESLIGYPSGVLSPIGSPSLINPEQGEYFSVTKMRPTNVVFPSVDSPISTVEVMLIGTDAIDKENKILIHETFNVPSMGGSTRAADPENS